MRKPYRVVIWGPGLLGGLCLREVIRLPEFELAGVLVYSDSKNGKDAGELVGMAPVGIKATMDKEEIYALDADCVLHTPADLGDFSADVDIVRLLESGKNVVTALPYHYPEIRGPEVVKKLESACHKGGATLHGSGLQPNFICERLGMTLTGMTNDIKYIKIQEAFEASECSAQLLPALGLGRDAEDVKDDQTVARIANNYYRAVVAFVMKTLGVTIDHIEVKPPEFKFAMEDIKSPVMTIKKGTVAAIAHSWVGYVHGNPFFTLETNWYMSEAMRPLFATDDDCWSIIVEGRPSVRLNFVIKESIEKDMRFHEGEKPAAPSYCAAAVVMTQAVPLVCAAEPGILYPSVFTHWSPDLRNLAE